MSVILYLIAASLVMAVVGLVLFFWAIKSGQYEDLKGASVRILYDESAAPTKQPAHHTQVPN